MEIKKYKEKGKAGFLLGNTGRQPVNKINKEKRTRGNYIVSPKANRIRELQQFSWECNMNCVSS